MKQPKIRNNIGIIKKKERLKKEITTYFDSLSILYKNKIKLCIIKYISISCNPTKKGIRLHLINNNPSMFVFLKDHNEIYKNIINIFS